MFDFNLERAASYLVEQQQRSAAAAPPGSGADCCFRSSVSSAASWLVCAGAYTPVNQSSTEHKAAGRLCRRRQQGLILVDFACPCITADLQTSACSYTRLEHDILIDKKLMTRVQAPPRRSSSRR